MSRARKCVRTETSWDSACEYCMADSAEVAGEEEIILCLMSFILLQKKSKKS